MVRRNLTSRVVVRRMSPWDEIAGILDEDLDGDSLAPLRWFPRRRGYPRRHALSASRGR